MSYQGRRRELVRREKELMVKFSDAHKNQDKKAKEGIEKEIHKNVEQRRLLKRSHGTLG